MRNAATAIKTNIITGVNKTLENDVLNPPVNRLEDIDGEIQLSLNPSHFGFQSFKPKSGNFHDVPSNDFSSHSQRSGSPRLAD
jgi:hypothetical protein